MALADRTESPLEFSCPRCLQAVSEAFYGPCCSCRVDLRTTLGGEARQVEAPDDVPKMTVTPTAVALNA